MGISRRLKLIARQAIVKALLILVSLPKLMAREACSKWGVEPLGGGCQMVASSFCVPHLRGGENGVVHTLLGGYLVGWPRDGQIEFGLVACLIALIAIASNSILSILISNSFKPRFAQYPSRFMSSSHRFIVCLVALAVCVSLVASGSEDSPIMDLDDVIGIEIQSVSLGERAVQEGKRSGLVIGDEPESDFTLVRRFDPRYVDYRSIQVRVAKGGWASSMMVIPNGLKSPPAVFVLDEECRHLKFPGYMPEDADIDEWEGKVYSRMPLGSQLIGSGFAVGFPTPKTMGERKVPLSVDDWTNLIKRFEDKARIDPESFFLAATHEYAELALKLAANMDFAGVVIEAPRELMFVKESEEWEKLKEEKAKQAEAKSKPREASGPADDTPAPDEISPIEDEEKKRSFDSESQMRYYVLYAQSIEEPKLIILAKESPEYERTRRTFLTSLVAAKSDFSAVLLDRSARSLMTPEEKLEARKRFRFEEEDEYEEDLDERGNPRRSSSSQMAFSYEEELFEQWVGRMNSFLIRHSKTEPHYLPLPEPVQRGVRGMGSVFGGQSGASGNYFEDSGGDDYGGEEGGDGSE